MITFLRKLLRRPAPRSYRMGHALLLIADNLGNAYEIGGINLGRVARAALHGTGDDQRQALQQIADACTSRVFVNGLNVGAAARVALERP